MYDKNDFQYFERSFIRDPCNNYNHCKNETIGKFQEFQPLQYSPKLTAQATEAIRRISWARGKPMTKILNALIMALPAIISTQNICNTCKNRSKCNNCIFGCNYNEEEKKALLKAVYF
ncbi:MAG: hypothetical protein FWB86_13990 [Treponema sp.]|nr:hypothetical protein [Treponema sp.]